MSFFKDILGPLYPIVDWPMNTGKNGGYNFFSGIGLSIFLPLVYLRKHNCHVKRCARLQWHTDPETGLVMCRKHHPEYSKKTEDSTLQNKER